VSLEYVDVSGERSKAHFDPIIQQLESDFNTEIELSFTEVPYENLRSTLLTRIGGGNAPDIAAIDQIWLGSFISSGNLMALDEVADDVDFDDYLDEFAEIVQRDDHVYGFPIGTDVRGMYWHKPMFESAGIPLPLPARIIIGMSAILLLLVVYAYFDLGWPYNDARIGVGFVGAIATLALALGIYYQAVQNQALIADHQRQSMILQESNWIPEGVFKPRGLQFRFTENSPHNPRVKLTLDHDETDWIDRLVGPGGGERIIGIGGGIFEEQIPMDDGPYEGILQLRFESTTGASYEYEYEVVVDPEADNDERITVLSETRKLPWRDTIE
jgi:hypothetical protein